MAFTAFVFFRILVIVFGLAGNVLALSAFAISRKMRQPPNIFIACLTVTDILYLLQDIFTITTEILGYRFFGEAVCVFSGTMALFLPQLFNDSIVAISVVRYINIVHMGSAKIWLTWHRCLVAVVVLIVHSLLCSLAAWTGWTRLYYADVIQACTLDWFYDIPATVVALVLNGIVLPNLIILYCYVRIYMTYRQSKQRVAAHKTDTVGGAHSDSKVKRELQLTLQIVVIYMVFVTTSLLLIGLTLFIDPDTPHHALAELAMLMLTVSTAINPPVYFYFNKALRLELIQWFSKRCCTCCRRRELTAASQGPSHSQESTPQAWKTKNSRTT